MRYEAKLEKPLKLFAQAWKSSPLNSVNIILWISDFTAQIETQRCTKVQNILLMIQSTFGINTHTLSISLYARLFFHRRTVENKNKIYYCLRDSKIIYFIRFFSSLDWCESHKRRAEKRATRKSCHASRIIFVLIFHLIGSRNFLSS